MNQIKINRVYKHFKGNYYLVEDVAIDSETLEEVVLYRSLYDDGILWSRLKKDFLNEVDYTKYPDALQKYKFELQDIKGGKK